MIDTHCHLLPDLDDGPRSLQGAVALGASLAADGVRLALCTPHYSRAFPTDHTEATERFTALRRALAEAAIPLQVRLAAEVGPGFAVTSPLAELTARSISGRYLIIEVLPDSPAGLFEAVGERLAEVGLTPIFAHPERCRAVHRHPTLMEEARERGALVQVVAPSLIRRWGRSVATAAWNLLGAGWVDLLGSDAHGVRRRRVHLAEAVGLIEARFGAELAQNLVVRNPSRVVEA